MKPAWAARLRSASIAAVVLMLLALLAYVALRTGPLAAVPVRVAIVEKRAIAPSLFGIGTVEAPFTHKIGPVAAGRIKAVMVEPGQAVRRGQLLGEMDPVDMDQRMGALQAARRRTEASLLGVQAQLLEASARVSFTQGQAKRYEQLFATGMVSTEAVEAKRQES